MCYLFRKKKRRKNKIRKIKEFFKDINVKKDSYSRSHYPVNNQFTPYKALDHN